MRNTQGDTMNEQTTSLAQGGHARRRRALVTGAAVAALGTALIGGSTLVGGEGEPGDTTEIVLTPAAGGSSTEPASAQPASLGTDQALGADQASATDLAAVEGDAAPPWQDSQPPLPEGGMSPENPDLPNAWQIPDARPTGVDYLDGFGAPRMGMNYPRMVPVFDAMVCNTGADDVEPLAGQNWMYYLGDGTDLDADSVDIVVTGWEDSTAARDALRDDTMTFCVRDTEGDWQQLEWAEHEGDDDYLLYQAGSGTGLDHSLAIVRQGDYLVGVTVTGTRGEAKVGGAAEIASKMADNLEVLAPVHGRD